MVRIKMCIFARQYTHTAPFKGQLHSKGSRSSSNLCNGFDDKFIVAIMKASQIDM